MMKTVKELGYMAIVTKDVNQAIKQALAMARKQDLICATGSFYLAGEIKRAFHKTSLYDNKKR